MLNILDDYLPTPGKPREPVVPKGQLMVIFKFFEIDIQCCLFFLQIYNPETMKKGQNNLENN